LPDKTYSIPGHGFANFNLPGDIKPGLTPITLEASIGNNRGIEFVEIYIERVPTYFDIKPTKTDYLRGEIAEVYLEIRDQTNKSLEGVFFPLIVSDADGVIIANINADSGSLYSIPTEDLSPGEYSVKVFYEGKEYEGTFNVVPGSIVQTPGGALTGFATGNLGFDEWSLIIGILALIIGVIRYIHIRRIEAKL
jgi:hypothetical protein